MTRPAIPAEAIEAAYLDLDTPLSVSAARLGIHPASLSQRARALGLTDRWTLKRLAIGGLGFRRCSTCREVKRVAEFSPHSRRCHPCMRVHVAAWRKRRAA